MILRAAELPKALYGCDVVPANENALQKLRACITKKLTYTTEQRSADFTFATCSFGPDLDADIHILTRRAFAFRRYLARRGMPEEYGIGMGPLTPAQPQSWSGAEGGETGRGPLTPTQPQPWKDVAFQNGEQIRAILERYKAKGDLGVHEDGDQARPKIDGGGPGIVDRAKVRKQCRPQGPCGLLSEVIHLQVATLDASYRTQQLNQQPIDIVGGPSQLVTPLIIRMVDRNRTRRAEGSREEAEGFIEIDTYATNTKHKNQVGDEERKLVPGLWKPGPIGLRRSLPTLVRWT